MRMVKGNLLKVEVKVLWLTDGLQRKQKLWVFVELFSGQWKKVGLEWRLKQMHLYMVVSGLKAKAVLSYFDLILDDIRHVLDQSSDHIIIKHCDRSAHRVAQLI
ncbi:unnamed protein product [Cuscuta epithymum]|uniref:Uncharacterized protein n=1 Tax=Cuscuta epithymum TaxID=186058 RepID=A0AAV0E3P0_9ASTE|nr:unnamed protein product [Cuscuta epithymum]CAH9148307.1 unnamed protein product [Cuscuta epithymum]